LREALLGSNGEVLPELLNYKKEHPSPTINNYKTVFFDVSEEQLNIMKLTVAMYPEIYFEIKDDVILWSPTEFYEILLQSGVLTALEVSSCFEFISNRLCEEIR
jgi:hypothetical protein